jgi:N6-adenosine-specific RNA methylase IME4
MPSNVYEYHPLADIFPLMEGAEFDGFVADVRAHGVREPIWIYQEKILDGRNRYRAATAAGVKCSTRPYEGNNPLGFVISLNLKRRHLNESQRAMVAARLATLKDGQRKSGAPIGAAAQGEAASMLNVGRRNVQRAREVIDKGTADLVHAVEQGKVPVSVARQIATHDAETQSAVVRRVDAGVKPLEAFRLQKAEKINANLLKNPSGKFRVFYADPAWRYGNAQPAVYSKAEDHYPTMKLEDICAIPVKDWAQDNAVLFLWVPSPMLEEAVAVYKAWGFKYKASFVWDKERQVMGHYNGVAHEFLLICVRGSCQPDVRKLYNSVVREKPTEHSKKPTVFYDIIDTLYPNGNRLELFQRGAGRKGWKCYGLESEEGE